jgi:hypothetical protein
MSTTQAPTLNSEYMDPICHPEAVLFKLVAYRTLMPLTGSICSATAATHRKAANVQPKSMLRMLKPIEGCEPWPDSKAALEAKVVEPRGAPIRKLMLSDVSVKVDAKIALAVLLLYAVNRDAKPLTKYAAVVLVRQRAVGLAETVGVGVGVGILNVGVGKPKPGGGPTAAPATRLVRPERRTAVVKICISSALFGYRG